MDISCTGCYHSTVCGYRDLCENADLCKQYVSRKELDDKLEANKSLLNSFSRVADAYQAAIDCINEIEDALDRGNNNDWARQAIESYRAYIRELID